jgi:D-amino peptidase
MKFTTVCCAIALSVAATGPAAAQDQDPAGEPEVVESTPPQSDAADPLKIFISADMEGVVGVVSDEQIGPGGFEYERFRGFMTAEVNACIEAARAAGATEILIADSHGNGQNLLIERLPKDVMLVRSWPRPLGMMEGIDASFDGVIFLGYHASAANERGVRAHTFSSASVTALRLNGISMSEASVNAAIAGHFGVPVIMVSGDNVAVAETQVIVGDVEGAVVKWAKGFHSAQTLTPEAAYDVIRDRTRAAIGRIEGFEPYVLETPLRLELSLKHYRPVELLSYLPGVERINSHTVGFVAEDIVEVARFLRVALGYSVDLQP